MNHNIKMSDIKYIILNKTVVTLTLTDKFWKDDQGTIYALMDTEAQNDPVIRCGVFPEALPNWKIFKKLNQACGPHDYAYSSPAYQAFHTRKEADDYLESLISQTGWTSIFAVPFWWLARKLGRQYWEGDK